MTYFLLYPLVFVLLRLLMRVLGRLQSRGEANVPVSGGVLLCPNHRSDCDPVAIFVSTPRRCWFVGKSELFAIPILGWFFAHFQGFPIKRDSADRAALRHIETLLKAGQPVVVFPEGRLSETGHLQKVQPGAALLSIRTGAPIVPVGLQHTDGVVPYGKLRPRFSPHPVEVVYGQPLDPKAYAALPRSQAVSALTEALTAALTDLPPLVPRDPSRNGKGEE